jgi:tripeptidyl-peptidase-1
MKSGIESERIKMSKSLTWIKFDATVEEAENLLLTEYNVYTNTKTGGDYLACEDYSVPAHIREHIDFITPTVHFDATVKKTPKRRDLQGRSIKANPVPHLMPAPDAGSILPSEFSSLVNCSLYTTPDCLRALYNFKNGTCDL